MKKYKLGYCIACINANNIASYEWLEKALENCEKFIIGIPDEWIMARLFGDNISYNAQETKKLLEETGRFEDVIILDKNNLSYRAVYNTVKYDICFYGTEYGNKFDDDCRFMLEHGIEFEAIMPNRMHSVTGGGSLRLALEEVQRKQKIVLFGTGAYFDAYMSIYPVIKRKFMPSYAIDNDQTKWNTVKKGVRILEPSVLEKENTREVLVVICSKNYSEILKQLKCIGKFNYRTMLFLNDVSLLEEFSIASEREDDYLINSHRILTDLMREFDRVCQENHLHYYMICGSLIGAVRHKGMIPWDDDIDIAMPRKDFKKLRKIARREWSKNNPTFVYRDYYDIGGGAFLDCMPRLFYMNEHLPTKCFDKVYGKASNDIEDRMFLDIYLLDSAHENDSVHNFVINCMKGVYNLMMGHRGVVEYDEYRVALPEKTIRLMILLHKVGKVFPIRFLAFIYDMLARSGNWNKKSKNYIMPSCAITCIELKYPKQHYGEGIRIPFENIEVMVPSDYDKQLNAMRYRNYMEYPRMSVRKPSHYFNSDIEIW